MGELRPLELWNERPDFDGSKQTGFGWVGSLTSYPWIYSWAFEGWVYVLASVSQLESMYLYVDAMDTWVWTAEAYNGWYYDYTTRDWVDITPEE